jgi:7-cyano-7-deazaguanine synthase
VNEVAVLYSGGLDSAVLVADEARRALVHPLYVSVGFAWEDEERRLAAQLLSAPPYQARVRSLVSLDFSVRDLYPQSHWAVRGEPPGFDTPDEDVYLVGRNLVLITKASIYCARHGLGRLALAPLADNPFPDARPDFLSAIGAAVSIGLDHAIEVVVPYGHLHKEDVIRIGVSLSVPFELTMSCMNPRGGQHCGACSKCRERQQAFQAAGTADPTTYRIRRTHDAI